MLRIDHVIHAVPDLEAAGTTLSERYGLASEPGGRHPGWGTGNRIVPLGSDYLELIAVVDPVEAEGSAFGRHVGQRAAGGDRLMGWCVAAERLDDVAGRLGLAITSGSRIRPDGTSLQWRSAGMEVALTRRFLPFFISWEGPPDVHPGRSPAEHLARPLGIAWVEVSGRAPELREWLGGEVLPVRVVDGPEDIRSVGIATEGGEVVLAAGDLTGRPRAGPRGGGTPSLGG